MFQTTIDSKPVKVEFQHQRAAWYGQLTRPEAYKDRIARVPVYATCFCFFNELCVGVAFCSYSDQRHYSKEIGRQVALKNALHTALKRSGKTDRSVASERAQVWEDYFRASTRKQKCNPLVIERGIRQWRELGTLEVKPLSGAVPMPTDTDTPPPPLPWKLGGQMPNDVIAHLNEDDTATDN